VALDLVWLWAVIVNVTTVTLLCSRTERYKHHGDTSHVHDVFDDGGGRLRRNVSTFLPQYTTFHSIKQYLRFEGFTTVTMKNAVFWDVASCGSKERTASYY
jgi:hypothetical protein